MAVKFEFDISYYRSGCWQLVDDCFGERSLALFGVTVASKGEGTALHQYVWHTRWDGVFK